SLFLNRLAVEKLKEESLKTRLLPLLSDEKSKKAFLKDPYSYYKDHPHSQIARDFVVIPSLGEYEGTYFQGSFYQIMLKIFLDMVKRYDDSPFDALYLDISSGLNVYNLALLESARAFLIFLGLQNFHTPECVPKLYLTFSEPIQSDKSRPHKIHKDNQIEVRAFFSLPLKPSSSDINSAFSKFAKSLQELLSQDRAFKNTLNSLLTKACFFYSTIKHNTPLVLYFWEHHPLEEVTSFLKELTELVEKKLTESYQKPPLDDETIKKIRDVYYTLALYIGLIKIFEQRGIHLKSEVSLSELEKNFRDERETLFKYFDLMSNRTFFGAEVENTIKNKCGSRISSEFTLLRDYLEPSSDEIHSRNFFAHCGLERNLVEIRGEFTNHEHWEVYLRYHSDETKRKKIEEFLMEVES
ncbi:MAG: TM1812 family CRISPR-associated protein, partial [Caldimicrobium sp.]|nr:TM1812 family CRISPR-associated protein [Caldimicrobium sp.]